MGKIRLSREWFAAGGWLEQLAKRAESRFRSRPSLAVGITLEEAGRRLHDDLASDSGIAAAFERGRDRALRLRIQAHVDDGQAFELYRLPWELLWPIGVAAPFGLDRRRLVVRDPGLDRPVRPAPLKPPLRVLIVAANGEGAMALDLEGEMSGLAAELASDQIGIDVLPAATLGAVREALARTPFHILHFLGHGDFDLDRQEGRLILSSGGVASGDFALKLADQPELRLVVLNACRTAAIAAHRWSGLVPDLLRAGVPNVVAVEHSISDGAARTFSRRFYHCLALGEPIEEAVTEGRQAIHGEARWQGEWSKPLLYLRSPVGELLASGERARLRYEALCRYLSAFEREHEPALHDRGTAGSGTEAALPPEARRLQRLAGGDAQDFEALENAPTGAGGLADRRGFFLILGEAGTGKTLLLRQLALRLARARLGVENAGTERASSATLVPVWVDAAEWAGRRRDGTIEDLLTFASERTGRNHGALDFGWLLEHRELAIFVDGLDRVGEVETRARLQRAIEILAREREGARGLLVVAAREAGPWAPACQPGPPAGLTICRIEPLDRAQQRTLASALGLEPWRLDELYAHHLEDLAANPRMLALLARHPGWTALPRGAFLATLLDGCVEGEARGSALGREALHRALEDAAARRVIGSRGEIEHPEGWRRDETAHAAGRTGGSGELEVPMALEPVLLARWLLRDRGLEDLLVVLDDPRWHEALPLALGARLSVLASPGACEPERLGSGECGSWPRVPLALAAAAVELPSLPLGSARALEAALRLPLSSARATPIANHWRAARRRVLERSPTPAGAVHALKRALRREPELQARRGLDPAVESELRALAVGTLGLSPERWLEALRAALREDLLALGRPRWVMSLYPHAPAEARPALCAEAWWYLVLAEGDPTYQTALLLDVYGGLLAPSALSLAASFAAVAEAAHALHPRADRWPVATTEAALSGPRALLARALDALAALPAPFEGVRAWALARLAPALRQQGLLAEAVVLADRTLSARWRNREKALAALLEEEGPLPEPVEPRLRALVSLVQAVDPELRERAERGLRAGYAEIAGGASVALRSRTLGRCARAPKSERGEALLAEIERMRRGLDRERFTAMLALAGDGGRWQPPLQVTRLGTGSAEDLARAWHDCRHDPVVSQILRWTLARLEHDDERAFARWTSALASESRESPVCDALLRRAEHLTPAVWSVLAERLRHGSTALRRPLLQALGTHLARHGRLPEAVRAELEAVLAGLDAETLAEDLAWGEGPLELAEALCRVGDVSPLEIHGAVEEPLQRLLATRRRAGDGGLSLELLARLGARSLVLRSREPIQGAVDRLEGEPRAIPALLDWILQTLPADAPEPSPRRLRVSDLLSLAAATAERLPSHCALAIHERPSLLTQLCHAVVHHDSATGRSAALRLLTWCGACGAEAALALQFALRDVAEVQGEAALVLERFLDVDDAAIVALAEGARDPRLAAASMRGLAGLAANRHLAPRTVRRLLGALEAVVEGPSAEIEVWAQAHEEGPDLRRRRVVRRVGTAAELAAAAWLDLGVPGHRRLLGEEAR